MTMSDISYVDVVKSFSIVICVITTIITLGRKAYNGLMWFHVKKDQEEDLIEKIAENDTKLKNIEKSQKENNKLVNEKIDLLAQQIDFFIAESQKDNQAVLRNMIQDIYRNTLDKGYITDYDNQNYIHLLERYEANSGNSYVVDVIKPYMKSVKVYLSDEEARKIEK